MQAAQNTLSRLLLGLGLVLLSLIPCSAGQLENLEGEDLYELSLLELLELKVTTVSKSAETIAEAPANVTVITRR